jgi:hypothetical protein
VTPVVGLLSSNAPDPLQAFRQGLKDTGCAERENMAIEYQYHKISDCRNSLSNWFVARST